MDRRHFIKSAAYLISAYATYSAYHFFLPRKKAKETDSVTPEAIYRERKKYLKSSIYEYPRESSDLQNELTSYESITSYNNFYEFSTDKYEVAERSKNWKINNWDLKIGGLVETPLTLSLDELHKMKVEERIYRFRCVEGWSMVIPWLGFPLYALLNKAKPKGSARFVAFESHYSESDMPGGKYAGISFPYREGLRLDEALHPLTILATGLYGRNMPNQNGAPVRLVVPWKYGFKSIKSIKKITLVEEQPETTWNIAAPNEYGFYSNVNPQVDHPRWSQKKERRIGENSLRETLMFNGYEKFVGHMYNNLDLKKYF